MRLLHDSDALLDLLVPVQVSPTPLLMEWCILLCSKSNDIL